jgi:MFS family permease
MKKILRAFKVRPFLWLWLGEIFTQISVNLLNFLLIFLVFSLTKSNTAVAWLVISFTIPAILFGWIAGVYVDRWDKKKVLFATNLIRAALLVVLAFFDTNIFFIYSISFLVALATQFFIPAESPMIPQVVESKLLYSANALFGIGLYGSILLAYILSGPVLIYFEQFHILLLIAVFLLIGAFFISLIKLPVSKKVSNVRLKPKNMIEEVRSIVSFIRSKPSIYHSLFFLAMTQILLLIIASIAPGYTNEVLKIDIKHFPLVFITPAALGVVVGAVLLSSILDNFPRNKMVTFGLFLSGLAILLMPFGSRIASRDIVHTFNTYLPNLFQISVYDLITVFAFALGLANAFIFVPSNTILQEATSEEQRGKIYGVLNSIVGLFSLLPLILVGGLSDLVGVGRVITGIGIGILCIGVGRLFIKWS